MVPPLLIAVAVLIVCITVYISFRRQRHGGLAGGMATTTPPRTQASLGSGTKYSAEEVARHNSSSDLWLIINDKVYNFTDYLLLHPGGEAIMRNAGHDSTTGFSGPQHPVRVWDMVCQRHRFFKSALRSPRFPYDSQLTSILFCSSPASAHASGPGLERYKPD